MKQDIINPQYYKAGKVECIEALESATIHKQGLEAVCVANVIKYLWRYESKGGLQDCNKAQWYLELLILHLEKKNLILSRRYWIMEQVKKILKILNVRKGY